VVKLACFLLELTIFPLPSLRSLLLIYPYLESYEISQGNLRLILFLGCDSFFRWIRLLVIRILSIISIIAFSRFGFIKLIEFSFKTMFGISSSNILIFIWSTKTIAEVFHAFAGCERDILFISPPLLFVIHLINCYSQKRLLLIPTKPNFNYDIFLLLSTSFFPFLKSVCLVLLVHVFTIIRGLLYLSLLHEF